MLPDLTLSHLIDRIEECAFNYKQYGTEVQLALRCIKDMWEIGHVSKDGQLTYDEFYALASDLSVNRRDAKFDHINMDYEFCYTLEQVLANFFTERSSISPSDGLQAAIIQYDKLAHPRAFTLLEALAKQSDLEHSKRHKEDIMRKLAAFSEAGVTLPEELSDITGFSADRFRHLADQIPKGQSVLDFYILNQIRHLLSRHAPEVIETVRKTGIPRNVFFGSLELGTPGAEIMPVEGTDEYLIILSRALWSATSLATGIIARCVELDSELPAPVNFSKIAAAELGDALGMLDRILRCESLDFEFPPHTDERRKQFWELLDSATKQFIFGHEYAHVLLGHIGSSSRQATDTGQAWNQELIADMTAINLILSDMQARTVTVRQMARSMASSADVMEGISTASDAVSDVMQFHVAAGAALVLYLFWRMEALHGRSASLTSSHPPPTFRLGCMWTFFRMNFDHFDTIFRFSNLMLRDFMSLLPLPEGTWKDRFQECAFGPLLLHPPATVADLLDQVNVESPLADEQLESVRQRLEELFQEPGTAYEEKYTVLEECAEMIRIYEENDPLRSIREELRARGVTDI